MDSWLLSSLLDLNITVSPCLSHSFRPSCPFSRSIILPFLPSLRLCLLLHPLSLVSLVDYPSITVNYRIAEAKG